MGPRGGRLRYGLGVCAVLLVLGSGCATDPIARPVAPTRGQIVQQILPTTVQIALEEDGRRVRSGSGVVIAARPVSDGADCYVLTSGHMLARLSGQETVYVLLGRHQGPGSRARATVLARRENEDLDLALLRIAHKQCVAARLGSEPALGDEIWVVAFPWGRNMTLVGGVVSQLNSFSSAERDMASRLMVDASVSYGASGGGVYEAATGRLIGLVEGYRTARVSFKGDPTQRYIDVPVPGETYVTPLADIQRFLTESGYAELVGVRQTIATPRP